MNTEPVLICTLDNLMRETLLYQPVPFRNENWARFTNYQFLPCQYGKHFFYKELQNITLVTKYNLFTVNKCVFTTLKSIMYKKNLTFSYTHMSK